MIERIISGGGGRKKNRSWRSAGRAKTRGTSMNGERNAEDVGEVGNRSVEWEASPCHSFNPFPLRLTSPLVLSERLRSTHATTSGHPQPSTTAVRPTSNRPATKLLPVQGCATALCRITIDDALFTRLDLSRRGKETWKK